MTHPEPVPQPWWGSDVPITETRHPLHDGIAVTVFAAGATIGVAERAARALLAGPVGRLYARLERVDAALREVETGWNPTAPRLAAALRRQMTDDA